MPTSFLSLQAENPVLVVNLDTINRDLKALSPAIYAASKAGMLEGAEPIRRDVERLAESEISGMKRAKTKPPPWSEQRDGETIHEVYIVPKQKGKRRGRTDGDRKRAAKFVGLMFDKAYDPAFETGRAGVVQFVDNWLGRVSEAFNSSTGTGRF